MLFFVQTRTNLVSRKGEQLGLSSNNSLTEIYSDTQEQVKKTQDHLKEQFKTMLCCFAPCTDPVTSYNAQTDAGPWPIASYPGQRRPINTAADPAAAAAAAAANNNNTAPLTLNVVVPAGMQPGQTLQVAAPDGSRTVTATIPTGVAPGQSFFVSFPAGNADSNSHGSGSGSGQGSNGPIPTPVAASVVPSTPAAQPLAPFSLALDTPPPAAPATNGNQKLLMVSVPPGTAVGSTLYVQVPGENRTLKAKVPPGVSQFHVAYQPRGAATPAPAPVAAALPVPVPAPVNYNMLVANPVPTTNNGQKLILVRVPPGSAPGSTLHIEVPDEPGRILAAQVPPNVAEFQVAYVPRLVQLASQQRPALQQQPAYDVRPNNSSVAGSGMMNNTMVPFAGAAAMGAGGGVAMYDHYPPNAGYHQDFGDPYGGGAGYYDDAGAYEYGGGVDYGGDYGAVY